MTDPAADALALIAAAHALPKTHAVVWTYADGRVNRFETRSAASAQTHLDFVIAPKLGRDLIDRATGDTVRIVSAEIETL